MTITRKFSSYGPIDKELHYYAPRHNLIELAYRQLLGENRNKNGHYITVWGPRQSGKTWIMQQILAGIRDEAQYHRFSVVKINVQHLHKQTDTLRIIQYLADEITRVLGLEKVKFTNLDEFHYLFSRDLLPKPLILLVDEFDSLDVHSISDIVKVLRNIYIQRQDESDKITEEKFYRLHGVALIGVRAVLGVENVSGSPFNVQRSIHIPNLTETEVEGMFRWYEQESGQPIEQNVIDRIFYEFRGQPGLTCWFGELLTEQYNKHQATITMADFENAFLMATDALPNNNILNIVSKAKQEPYQTTVLKLFDTDNIMKFAYDDPQANYLYLNGVVDAAEIDNELYLKFPCPFVQRRLFNYFAREIFTTVGRLYDPFEDLSHVVTERAIQISNLLRRYEGYLAKNRHWLLKNVPRRKDDLRIYEAVYHFNFYMYLARFFQNYPIQVNPEFPTGNGKIDILIDYAGQRYGLEIKSFSHERAYKKGLEQAARYGQSLGLSQIWLVLFVEAVDETNRQKYEISYTDPQTGVQVHPQFIQLGVDEQALA